MFPNTPKPNRSSIAFPGFPIPDRTVQAFPGFPTIGKLTAAEIFNYLDGWNQSQIYEITIDSSLIDEDLTNFPVLINFIIMPIIWDENDKSADISLVDNDTTATATTTSWKSCRNEDGRSTGKLYFEIKIKTAPSSYNIIGIMSGTHTLASYCGNGSDGWGYNGYNGYKFNNGGSTSYGSTFTAGDVVGVAVDLEDGKLYFANNNVWQNSADLDAGTGFAYDTLSGTVYPACSPYTSGNALTLSVEAVGCTYAPPTGYEYWNECSYTDLFNAVKLDISDMVLLIHSDTTDGSTTFTDSSDSEHTITVGGNTHHETDQKKFGDTSIYFDGTGDYLSVPDSTDWTFGSADFTIDFWMSRSVTSSRGFVFGQVNSSGTATSISIRMEIDASDVIHLYRNSTDHDTGYSFSVTDTFKHFAVVRNGTDLSLYVDGISEFSVDISTTALIDSSNTFSVGRQGEYDGLYFTGYIDEFRIVKGTAVWTDDFTPRTVPYPHYTIDEVVPKLAVADVSGNQLYAEVQEWDSLNEILIMWTKVPTIKASEDTKLYLYYDDTQDTVTAAFDSTQIGSGLELTNTDRTLNHTSGSTAYRQCLGLFPKSSGKHYFEAIVIDGSGGNNSIGVQNGSESLSVYVGDTSNGWGYMSNNRLYNSSYIAGGGLTPTDSIIGVAVNLDTGEIWWSLDNTWVGTGSPDPATGTDSNYSNLSGTIYPAISLRHTPSVITLRLKEVEFTYNPPVGFSPWEDNAYTAEVCYSASKKVWDDNFKLVYHMNQDPSAAADCMLDSTQNANHGTPTGTMLTEDLVQGLIGKSIDFDGSDDTIDLGTVEMIDSAEPFTISVLLNLDAFTDNYPVVITTHTNEAQNWRWVFSNQAGYLDMSFGSNSVTFANGTTGDISLEVDTDYLVTLVYNGEGASTLSNYTMYVDGVSKTLSAGSAFGSETSANTQIGGYSATDVMWDGLIHDVRISDIARSAAWIKATNKSNRNLLLTIAKKV